MTGRIGFSPIPIPALAGGHGLDGGVPTGLQVPALPQERCRHRLQTGMCGYLRTEATCPMIT